MKILRSPSVAASLLFALLSTTSPAQSEQPSPTSDSKNIAPVGIAALPGSLTGSETPSPAVENSVVKVFSTVRAPDPYRPWTKREPQEISGSGAIISGKRILTNAHVVLHASQVQVQANQAGDRVSATVEAIAPGIDLAILKVDDESLFNSRPPLAFRKNLPEAKDAVMVYGYPTGGTSLSITKGIISRIEFTGYSSSVAGLRIQIDAAINPGNSGGPAVVDDQMVGLAFSRLGGETQSIGYIIPSEEIELFLKNVDAHGHYGGKLMMYDDLQTLENPALRESLHLAQGVEGIVVHRPLKSDASYPLKEWDVITKIGDTPVDDEGMIKVNDQLRVRFAYQIQKIAQHDAVPLTVARGGKLVQINLPLLKQRPSLIAEPDGGYPPYFIYGPLVLSEGTAEFLGGLYQHPGAAGILADLTYRGSPLITRLGEKQAFEGERLVVVSSPFFPHKLIKGYSDAAMQVVKSINGHKVKNLADAVAILRDLKEEFVTVDFDLGLGGESLVLPRAKMVAATDEILTDNGIREQGSPGLVAIWKDAEQESAVAEKAAEKPAVYATERAR